jgi:amino acid transporter
MMLATGALMVSIALLTLAALVPIFRRSDPPRWTTRGWIGEIVTVGIVSLLALGLVYFIVGIASALQADVSYLDVGLLVVVVVASIAILRGMKSRARSTVPEPAANLHASTPSGAAEASPAAAGGPPPPHKAA